LCIFLNRILILSRFSLFVKKIMLNIKIQFFIAKKIEQYARRSIKFVIFGYFVLILIKKSDN